MNYKTLVCPNCQGVGKINGSICSSCRGLAVAALVEDTTKKNEARKFLFYWNKRVDGVVIAADRLHEISGTIGKWILRLLFAGGLVGFIFYALESFKNLVSAGMTGYGDFLFSPIFWLAGDVRLLIFWVGILCFLYLKYLSVHSEELKKTVFKTEKGKIAGETKNPPLSRPLVGTTEGQENEPDIYVDWKEVNAWPAEYKIDISTAFTPEAHRAIKDAWQLAQNLNNPETDLIHLLVGLAFKPRIASMFVRLGLDFGEFKEKIKNNLKRTPDNHFGTGFSFDFRRALLFAYFEAQKNDQEQVDIEELLVAIGKEQGKLASEILYAFDIDYEKIVNVVEWLRINEKINHLIRQRRSKSSIRAKGGMNRAMTSLATPFLNAFGTDLTEAAQHGYLAPCVGREEEIEAILRVIEGGVNSVILVGQGGVGKTAIVDGLASRMAAYEVPKTLFDKRLVSLSAPKLISGASSSEAEARLMKVLEEIIKAGNVILFIDNIQDLVGITSGAEGSLDLSEVLVSAINKKQIVCVATAPAYDYYRHIEHNTALGSALEKIEIEEMEDAPSIWVLESKVGYLEHEHKIYFSYDALAQAVKLSSRYIHNQFLPAKAISVLEEVAVYTAEMRGANSIVSGEDVAYVISRRTKIPLTRITVKETTKLLDLDKIIHERMINQEHAVKAIVAALRRARVELRERSRPISNFLFLGPTGVGKTELAKTVAAVYFGEENNMIRLDMSEYQEKNSVTRLLGAPVGSSTEGEGGYLTEAVRRNPFSLVLLDEIEKAHADILNIFLQVMDDGRLTDNTGRTIDFTNTIIIGTSNAGTQFIQDSMKAGLGVEEVKKQLTENELSKYFKPEFLNRFDSVCVFTPLKEEHLHQITRLMLKKVEKMLTEKGVNLKVSDEAVNELSHAGYDPVYGARPLRRVIQEKVEDVLAQKILQGELSRRDTVLLLGIDRVEVEKGRMI